MSLHKETRVWLIRILAVTALFGGFVERAEAQDPSIFTTFGNFVSGFTDVSGFVAPAGFIRSDVLRERGSLLEIGIIARNQRAGLLVGFDILTGFGAKQPGLDLRGSVVALPTIMTTHEEDLYIRHAPPLIANIGFGLGLSQIQNGRTQVPQSPGVDRALELGGNGYHAGVTYGISTTISGIGVFIDGSYRYTNFPSLEWREAGKAVAPPVGWPTSMGLRAGTIRIGIGTPPPPSSGQ
jgi:hypothetical protein